MATKKRKSKRAKEPLAIQLLTADHKAVDVLFKKYERLGDRGVAEKSTLIRDMCTALEIHAQIEEEIFYPALRKALGQQDAGENLDEAEVEHEHIKTLVKQLKGAKPTDDLADARVKVLTEYVRHHVEEEQNELFPKAKKAKALDLEAIGARLLARKEALMPDTSGATSLKKKRALRRR